MQPGQRGHAPGLACCAPDLISIRAQRLGDCQTNPGTRARQKNFFTGCPRAYSILFHPSFLPESLPAGERFARQRDALREAGGRQGGTHVFAILFFFKTAREIANGLRCLTPPARGRRRRRQVEFIRETSPAPATTRAVESSSPQHSPRSDREDRTDAAMPAQSNPAAGRVVAIHSAVFRLRQKKAYVIPPALAAISQLQMCAVTATGVQPQNSSPPSSSVNSPPTGQERSSWWWTTIGFIRATRSRRIFIITNNCRMPRFAFAG